MLHRPTILEPAVALMDVIRLNAVVTQYNTSWTGPRRKRTELWRAIARVVLGVFFNVVLEHWAMNALDHSV
jgi:hypothetical protein